MTLVRLTSATLTQYLSSQSRLADPLTGAGGRRHVVLLRAEPRWDGPHEHTWNGARRARVATAPSPLAVHELVLGHLDAPGGAADPLVLVVLTDCESADLDPGILARVHKRGVNTVDTWDVVRAAFGASDIDGRLRGDGWAAEALLDATPPGGWPPLRGGILARGTALSQLALRRLRLGRYASDRPTTDHPATSHSATGAPADPPAIDRPDTGITGLDTHTLLRWSLTPGAPESFLALREAERDGLVGFLREPDQAGAVADVLFGLVTAGNGADAVPFGLVCSALWDPTADTPPASETYRARGRAERWLGEKPPAAGDELDAVMAAYGRASREYVEALLATGRGDGRHAEEARRLSGPALDRAGQLVRQFAAETAAAASPILREGLAARFTAVGHALAEASTTDGIDSAARAVGDLAAHRLAADDPVTTARVERARMGLRLARWLATGPDTDTPAVADGIDRQIGHLAWVDRALDHVEAGGDPDPALQAAYDALTGRARQIRHTVDRSFAHRLAEWTRAGTEPGTMLTVESFLSRVVAPVARARGNHQHRVLLLLLDGMSAAIATQLGAELRRRWAEFDPLPPAGDGADAGPRRRGMVAALPTVTAVSRTSLFAGRLLRGTQADERRIFPEHRFWGRRGATIFHKDALADGARRVLAAITETETHVAVVLNTIDDRLAKEARHGDHSWSPAEIRPLEELLRAAAGAGMAVILTSDHGHVLERRDTPVPAGTEAHSARHREPGGPLAETEIELTGPRVVSPEPGGRVVALWDSDSRYTGRSAGYHGGASPAEVTIPVLALLPFGVEPPRGWRELGAPEPYWWAADPEDLADQAARARPEPVSPVRHRPRKGTRREDDLARTHEALFDVGPDLGSGSASGADPTVTPARPDRVGERRALAERLLASEVFGWQVELLARRPSGGGLERIRQAVEVLLEARTLSVEALAQRVGERPGRAVGFAATLQQLLNHDGVQVLERLPDGRTLRLHERLLRDQFGLGG